MLAVDIERPTPANVLQLLTVSDAMLALPAQNGHPPGTVRVVGPQYWSDIVGLVSEIRRQVIFADKSLEQALRQLVLYGRAGLPVLSADGQYLRGWVTRHSVLRVLAERVQLTQREAEQGRLVAEFSDKDAAARLHVPPFTPRRLGHRRAHRPSRITGDRKASRRK